MCSNLKRLKFILGCSVTGILSLAAAMLMGTRSRSWGVLFSGIPERICTSSANHNAVLYILKQTHEPVFRIEDGQNYSSNILKRWRRTLDDREFTFCPDTSLQFDEKTSFTEKLFADHISGVTKRYSPDYQMKNDGSCVTVRFKEPRTGYLQFLTLYENAPTVVRNPFVENGLGQFTVENLSKDRVELRRKNKVRNGVNRIVVYDYKGGNDEKLQDKEISDYNRIPSFDVPKMVRSTYAAFDNIQLESVALVLNHKDPAIRERLYNCINTVEFREAYFPNIAAPVDIANIFPLGVPGAKAGLPRQVCSTAGQVPVKVVLANWRDDNQESLKKFSTELRRKTGINIVVNNYQPSELAKIIHRQPRPYNLLVMGIDAVRPDFTAFLSPFFRANSYIDFKPADGYQPYLKMQKIAGLKEQTPYAEKIVEDLNREHVVIPLYQVNGQLFYPKGIKNLEAGRGFLEYPEVADFRW